MFFLTAKRDVKSKFWQRYISRYDGLEMSPEARAVLDATPWKFKKLTNGVGSQVGIFNKIVMALWLPIFRNCLMFLDITAASDIHDVEYSLKLLFKIIADGDKFKRETDLRFYRNMLTIVSRQVKPKSFWLIPISSELWFTITKYRKSKAWVYYQAVHELGNASFWNGKKRPIE